MRIDGRLRLCTLARSTAPRASRTPPLAGATNIGLAIALALALGSGAAPGGRCRVLRAGELVVTSDFPGGSAEVVQIDQAARCITLRPADHPQRGWRCWWYFRVAGIAPGETLRVRIQGDVWSRPQRATFSTDGTTWQHTEPGHAEGEHFVYRQSVEAPQAWFAWGPPFVPGDAEDLVRRAAQSCPQAESFNLCNTREGRPTPALRVAPPEGRPPRHGVWIQARQHAWESGSSWVARGLVEWLVSDDPQAAALRETALVVVVPIMDIDNVHRGAGGKNEQPQDHNRDWTEQPHHRAVAAAQQAIKQLDDDGRLDVFLDLHNPAASDREPFFFVPPAELLAESGRDNLQRFVQLAADTITGPLTYRGRTRESGASYDRQWRAISKNWVALHCRPHVLALTLETPWNTPHSTTEGYRQIGRELGQTIARYLQGDAARPGR
jgi:hypothetical protein